MARRKCSAKVQGRKAAHQQAVRKQQEADARPEISIPVPSYATTKAAAKKATKKVMRFVPRISFRKV